MIRRLTAAAAAAPTVCCTHCLAVKGAPLVRPSAGGVVVASLVDSKRWFSSTLAYFAMRKFRGRQQRHREPKEGDWLCACGETNYRSKRECYKCGAPAPPLPPGVRRPSLPGEDPHDWACPCGKMNFRGSVLCFACKQPKPVAPKPPGEETTMWRCPGCASINRSTRRHCFKCTAPSPVLSTDATAKH